MAESRGDANLIKVYKTWLRAYVDKQPRGLHARLARRFGTNKSFVSQVLNPDLPTALPPRHMPALLDICGFNRGEKDRFLEMYANAHGLSPGEIEALSGPGKLILEISLPEFENVEIRSLVEKSIRSNADAIIALAQIADRKKS